MDAALNDLEPIDTPELDTLEGRDAAFPQDAEKSRQGIFKRIKAGIEDLRWYSVRYWRHGIAALTIYSAMFAIWAFAVR